MLLWKENGHERISFHFGRSLRFGDLLQVINQPIHQLAPYFLVRHFPSAEDHRRFRFVAFRQESHNVILLELEIVLFRFRPELDLFHYNLFLVLLCLVGSLAFLVLELAVIHDTTDGRIGSGSHLHQIQFARPGKLKRLLRSHDSQLPGSFINHPDLFGSDQFIDPDLYWLGCCDWQPPFVFEVNSGPGLMAELPWTV